MSQFMRFGHAHATPTQQIALAEQYVDLTFQKMRPLFVQAVVAFIGAAITPLTFFTFEMSLLKLMSEFGRTLLESVVNGLEPSSPDWLPYDLTYNGLAYRRRNEKTRNANIATQFGVITLMRRAYRDWTGVEQCIFPLELCLGFTAGVSPALVDWIGQRMAEAGASQSRVLAMLLAECGVAMGVKRLRSCLEKLSASLGELRMDQQVAHLLELLKTANESRGNRKPVLAVGRDGITLQGYWHRCFQVATAATVSVYDRAGKRLGTVYLAYAPELDQLTMNAMLTSLLTELFRVWTGPLPQLAYVTDCGSHECSYYKDVLSRMLHPITGQRLRWQRVVDFYHASERVWAMATALFGDNTQAANAWAHRMLKALKKPNGASRVLHSAAALFHRFKLPKTRAANFWKAYRYIQKRTRYMCYHAYAAAHIPLGSGVTEAACKTIFTQRLKLSGMRWTTEGANTILTLRVILLSNTWQRTFNAYLEHITPSTLQPYASIIPPPLKNRRETTGV
jgi:hypothetical protein